MEFTRILLALVGILLGTPSYSQSEIDNCPQGCNCEDTTVLCPRQRLFQIPGDIPVQTTFLDLQSNNITAINSYTFVRNPNLKDIFLSNNQIDFLGTWSFFGLGILDTLDLRNNKIRALRAGTFAGLKLRALILDDNPLVEIDPGTFVNSSIEELWIRRCDLQFILPESFSDLRPSLKVLHITDNLYRLPELPVDFLEGFQLRVLFLENNGIRDTRFLQRLQASTLQLHRNPIGHQVLNSTAPLSCGYLYLEDTGIVVLNIDIPRIAGLRSLSLANNKLVELDASVFRYNRGILTLNVRNNSILAIRSTFAMSLPHLKILDIGHNKLHVVNPTIFIGLVLDFLSLENNRIQTLSQDFYPVFRSCRNIYLTNNPLHCNCEILWLYSWMRSLAKYPTIWDAECASPTRLKFAQAKPTDFSCTKISMTMDYPGKAVEYGSDVTITCTGYGDPSPDMHLLGPGGWTKSNKAPKNKTITQNDIQARVANFTCKDVGVYACSASSHLGSALNYTKVKITNQDCSHHANSLLHDQHKNALHILKQHMSRDTNGTTQNPKFAMSGADLETRTSQQVGAAEGSLGYHGKDRLNNTSLTITVVVSVCSAVAVVIVILIATKVLRRGQKKKKFRLRHEGRMDVSFINTAYLTQDDLVIH